MKGYNYKQNYIVSLVLIAFFVIVAVYSANFKKTAGVFPITACCLGIFCSAAMSVETFMKQRKHEKVSEAKPTTKENAKKTAIVFAGLFLYALGVTYIGFAVASFVFLCAMSIMFSEQHDKKTVLWAVVINLIITAVVYILFHIVMKITLPHKLLF